MSAGQSTLSRRGSRPCRTRPLGQLSGRADEARSSRVRRGNQRAGGGRAPSLARAPGPVHRPLGCRAQVERSPDDHGHGRSACEARGLQPALRWRRPVLPSGWSLTDPGQLSSSARAPHPALAARHHEVHALRQRRSHPRRRSVEVRDEIVSEEPRSRRGVTHQAVADPGDRMPGDPQPPPVARARRAQGRPGGSNRIRDQLCCERPRGRKTPPSMRPGPVRLRPWRDQAREYGELHVGAAGSSLRRAATTAPEDALRAWPLEPGPRQGLSRPTPCPP